MFTIKFNNNGEIKSASFDKYFDLVKFVARERIKDEDFVAIDLGEGEIEGLYNFADKVIEKVEAEEEAMARAMEMMASMDSEDDDFYSEEEEYNFFNED